MPDDRERLIRECFGLERDLNYPRFRHHHWHDREVVEKCPDPAEREAMLRGFWDHDAEKRLPEYREACKGDDVGRLLDLRADLVAQAGGVGLTEWERALRELARVPANDNDKRRDR